MQKEIFASVVRSAGDLAGAFECDGDTGYFYLYRTKDADGSKIVDALHLFSGRVDLTSEDISIRWDDSETKVALFIKGVMWAVFNCKSGKKFGRSYRVGETPGIPPNFAFVEGSR